MQFRQVDVYTKSEAIQVLVMRLSELGLNGFIIHDPADFEEFLENKEYNWDYVDDSLMGLKTVEPHITCYVQDNEQGAEMLSALGGTLDELKENDTDDFYGSLDVTIDCVREEDWANNWKQYFKPLKVGKKLLVKPSWEECSNTDGRVILDIDPASSFGTGQHNTTKLCLELLEESLNSGDRVLDLGCGSGILSIGAMLLGASEVTAVDIEQNAVETAIENAAKNNITKDKYMVYCGDVISNKELCEKIGGGYDLITANIVADVLIAMKDIFHQKLKNNGILIISGIIIERKDEVVNAVVHAGFEVIDTAEVEGWAAVKLKAI